MKCLSQRARSVCSCLKYDNLLRCPVAILLKLQALFLEYTQKEVIEAISFYPNILPQVVQLFREHIYIFSVLQLSRGWAGGVAFANTAKKYIPCLLNSQTMVNLPPRQLLTYEKEQRSKVISRVLVAVHVNQVVKVRFINCVLTALVLGVFPLGQETVSVDVV